MRLFLPQSTLLGLAASAASPIPPAIIHPQPKSAFLLGLMPTAASPRRNADCGLPPAIHPQSSRLLPARYFVLAFCLPQFQPTKSQGENTEHQPTTHNQPTINPQSTHKQTRPCARSHALLPAWCFRLGFFHPTIPTRKKPRRKHQTPTHRPQGRVCFIPHTHSACSGVLGV